MQEQRELVASLIKRHDDSAIWDGMRAKDVPAEIVDYVRTRLEEGFDFQQIRRQLKILRATDKSWVKIMSALKQGWRIDGPALLTHLAHRKLGMAERVYKQIMTAMDDGVQVLDKEGNIVNLLGPQKELAAMIDTYNRLTNGFIKDGKDLGAFMEQDNGKAAGGVTIVVKTNVPAPPSQEEIRAHQDRMAKKNAIEVDGVAIEVTGVDKR